MELSFNPDIKIQVGVRCSGPDDDAPDLEVFLEKINGDKSVSELDIAEYLSNDETAEIINLAIIEARKE